MSQPKYSVRAENQVQTILLKTTSEDLNTPEEQTAVLKYKKAYYRYLTLEDKKYEICLKRKTCFFKFLSNHRLRNVIRDIEECDYQMREIENSIILKDYISRELARKNAIRIEKTRQWVKEKEEKEYQARLELYKEKRKEAEEAFYVGQKIRSAINVDDKSLSNTARLAVSTISATYKTFRQHPDSYICKSKLACADSIIYSCFLVRAMCIGVTSDRAKAEQFSNEFVNYILLGIEKLYINDQTLLYKMFDNRMALYDRIFQSTNGTKNKFIAIMNEFEILIKANAYYDIFLEFTESSPLPLLEFDEETQCQIDIAAFNDCLASAISSDLEQVQQSL